MMKIDECYNQIIMDAYYKCRRHLSDHKIVMVGYSGGSDSDTMVDLIQSALNDKQWKYLFKNIKIHYVWFDTGIEYEATKKHIEEIEKKYGITIERVNADMPVPLGCKTFGVPFLSKYVSQMISRLQKHNFDFAKDGNKPYEELIKLYPNCKSALGFWSNAYGSVTVKKKSHFNINQFYGLKEFMIANPPDFKISDKCCQGAKKDPSHKYEKEHNIDLKCLGLRGAEGGVRATNIKSCFSEMGGQTADIYRPIWWFKNTDKAEYKTLCNLTYSDCYEKYGFTRTGCACCPFGSNFEEELEIVKQYEPKLYIAVNNIFGKSYEYTRKYRQFKEQLKTQQQQIKGQLNMFMEEEEDNL